MTSDRLTAILAERILGWKVMPDRIITSGRSWIPRWRFSPFTKLDDAFQLLESSRCTYTFEFGADGRFSAQVKIGDRVGRAFGKANAHTITLALALALGLEAEQ
jgi:hypothetical protein